MIEDHSPRRPHRMFDELGLAAEGGSSHLDARSPSSYGSCIRHAAALNCDHQSAPHAGAAGEHHGFSCRCNALRLLCSRDFAAPIRTIVEPGTRSTRSFSSSTAPKIMRPCIRVISSFMASTNISDEALCGRCCMRSEFDN